MPVTNTPKRLARTHTHTHTPRADEGSWQLGPGVGRGGEHRCPQHQYLPTCEGTVGSPWLGELIRILLFSGLLKERGIQTFAGRYFIFTTFSQLVKIVARRSFLARSAHSRLGSPGSHGSGFRSPGVATRGAGAWGKVQLLIQLHQGEGQGLQS